MIENNKDRIVSGNVGEGLGMNAIHPYIDTQEQSIQQKQMYAIGLLRTGDPFKAALVVFPNDPAKAVAAKEWVNDPYVIEERERLIAEHGEEFFLPNEIEFARTVWALHEKAPHHDDKIKYLELYAKTRGFTKKESGPSINVAIAPKVMLLAQHVEQQSDDEWEVTLRNQQRTLTHGSNGTKSE